MFVFLRHISSPMNDAIQRALRMVAELGVELYNELMAPKRRPSRRPNYFRPMLEGLEERWCPAGTWYWFPTDGTSNAGSLANWNSQANGQGTNPTSQLGNGDTAVFDGSNAGGNKPCTWNYPNSALSGVTVQNGYNQLLTLNKTLTTAGQLQVSNETGTTLNLECGATIGGPGVNLTNGADVFVTFGGQLILTGSSVSNTFFQGDGKAGEILDNAGKVLYDGAGGRTNVVTDYLKVPVLNEGQFILKGGLGGVNAKESELYVTPVDNLTDSYSWYQDVGSAETDLSGGAYLYCEYGYKQTGGLLKTTDASTCQVGGGATDQAGTFRINGGKVQVDPGTTAYGKLFFNAQEVFVTNAEIDVKFNGQDTTQHDLIKIGSTAAPPTLDFSGGGDTFGVTAVGNVKGGQANKQALIQMSNGSIKGWNATNVKVNAPTGTDITENDSNTEIDLNT